LAAKELNKRGWMYNKKFFTFFQLQGPPKTKTDEYVEGKFKYFDFEEGWVTRPKKDYKFEYQMLENID
jgi:CCR4-NOT transcriptional regulation complex NOT5 subunit